MRKLILLLCLLSLPAWATNALTNNAQAYVMTTGSDSNAGWFDASVGSPGTNEALNAAGTSYTDIIVGATTTQATSVLHPFTSTTHGPGNSLWITSGTGCTTGIYVMNSQSGGTATFSASLGTAASVCTGVLGGGLLTICGTYSSGCQTGAYHWAQSNVNYLTVINVKQGTYQIGTVTIQNINGANLTILPSEIFGYTTTPGDWGTTRPVITTTGTVPVVQFKGDGQPFFNNYLFNVVLQTTSVTYGNCLVYHYQTGVDGLQAVNVKFDHSAGGTSAAGICVRNSNGGLEVLINGCEFSMGSNDVGYEDQGNNNSGVTAIPSVITHSWFHGGAYGIWDDNVAGNQFWLIDHSAFSSNGYGVYQQNGSGFAASITYSDFYDNTTANVQLNNNALYWLEDVGNIMYGGTYGFNTGGGIGPGFQYGASNAFGGVTTDYYGPIPSSHWGNADVALGSCQPFNAPSSGDFSLSSCGKTALSAAGFPGVTPFGTGYAAVGALQPQAAAATAPTPHPFVQ